MNRNGHAFGRGRQSVVLDKVDMSLDDIIRLNRKEKQQTRSQQETGNHRAPPSFKKKSSVPRGKRVASKKWGTLRPAGPTHKGNVSRGALTGVRGWGRKVLPVGGRRKGQGVVTGLAARRTAVKQKGLSPFNRLAVNQRKRPILHMGTEGQYRRLDVQRKPYRQTEGQRGPNMSSRRPFRPMKRPVTPSHQVQRDARQTTFLLRRGLKIHTQTQKPAFPSALASSPVRTRQWCTSTNSSGILTVSIDNPTARVQPESPSVWSQPFPAPIPAPVKVEEVTKKPPPKGVPLQFDINSVGKPQTAMTLNERFCILKDKRAAAAPAQASKGTRYVTVG